MKNIIPYSGTADYIINSAMPYELPLYKSKLFDGFSEWAERYKNDPLRQDAYMRASRVHSLFETVIPESDDTVVPKNSVIREFIGGLEIG
jgi:uridine kinase